LLARRFFASADGHDLVADLLANCRPKWPRPPIPNTAIKFPGRDGTDFSVDAQRKIAATARIAIVSGVPAHPDALAFVRDCDAGAGFVDEARYFMAGNARVGNAGKEAVFPDLITGTDAAGLNLSEVLAKLVGCGMLRESCWV